jgi:hypothetical protein
VLEPAGFERSDDSLAVALAKLFLRGDFAHVGESAAEGLLLK